MIKIKNKAIVFLLLLITILLIVPTKNNVYANEVKYSNVLEDLQADNNFKIEDYPEKLNDYSLQVIAVAESSNKELIVYVYQPSGQAYNLVASSINISKTSDIEVSPYNYKLKLLSSSGTLYKYVVEDFMLSKYAVRYYSIISIFRKFDKELGDKGLSGNTVDEVSYKVSRQWKFVQTGKNVEVTCEKIDVIVVTDKFCGLVRYDGGFVFGLTSSKVNSGDRHFIAFNTDMNIDELYEADISFVYQSYYEEKKTLLFWETRHRKKFGNKTSKNVTLTYQDDKVIYKGDGFFAPKYKWDTIQTLDEFVKSVDISQRVYSGAVFDKYTASKITDENRKELKNKKWVLSYYFSEKIYNCYDMTAGTIETWDSAIVGQTTILRLKFRNGDKVYNLGVVDNKQTGSLEPINRNEWSVTVNKSGKNLWKVVKIVAIVFLCSVAFFLLAPVLPYIFKGILIPFKLIFKGVKKLARKDE